MEVNGSTLRTSVFMTPEPSILGPSPPLVMQSPHSDQLQAVSSSRNDRAAAIRNMTQSSNGAAVELMWRGVTRYAKRQWVMDFCLTEPAPDTFDWSFGEPTYQIVPTPDACASSSSFAFTVTSPAPLTTIVARLARRSAASSEPAPLTVIDRLSDRPAKLPLADPEIVIDSESVLIWVALILTPPLIVSSRKSRTVTLMRVMRGTLSFQLQVSLFPSATPM